MKIRNDIKLYFRFIPIIYLNDINQIINILKCIYERNLINF